MALVSCTGARNLATADPLDAAASEVSETIELDPTSSPVAATPTVDGAPDRDIHQSFEDVTAPIAGDVGVAIASGNGVQSFGSWKNGPAWSTIKVPLAIAALRHSGEAAMSLVDPAIRDSDNAAAESLWAQLGQPLQASQSVRAVLQDAGDDSTVVQSEKTRSEFTPFGQTDWSLASQAVFMSKLPCLRQSEIVIEDMRNVGVNQQWGLARRGNAAVKGGWGPSPDGRYLVRQIALVETDSGIVGVAVASAPSDGVFQTGTTQVDALADWVTDHLGSFPGARC